MTAPIWTFRDDAWTAGDFVGYSVEALDGGIGKIDEATYDAGSAYLVVDTGPWIFGKKVLLPAGVIDTVDHDDTTVFVQRTKDEIKNAPEYDPDRVLDATYRDQFGSYYGPGGAGYSEGTREYSGRGGSRTRDF
jgi:hypothetical protein